MNQSDLAKELGVSRVMVCKWKQKGMPIDDLGKAKDWLSVNVAAKRRGEVTALTLPAKENQTQAHGDTWEARLSRIRDSEREAGALVMAAIQSGAVAQLPNLLRCHSQAVEAVAVAEKLASDARMHSGELINRETVRSVMRELLTPLREALDKLPLGERTNCNPDHPEIAERALTEWRDKLILRANKVEDKF